MNLHPEFQGSGFASPTTPPAGDVSHDGASAIIHTSHAATSTSPGRSAGSMALRPGGVPLPDDEFTLVDTVLCREIAGEFNMAKLYDSARAWTTLGLKVDKVLVGEFVAFTRMDAQLIQALHVAVLRDPLKPGAKERSRSLSRLGVLVVQAERGTLAQLRRGEG